MKRDKNIVLRLLLFFQILPFIGASQTTFAPIKGAKWTYTYRSFSFLNGISVKTNGIIKATYSKDTMIEGREYKFILLNYFNLDSLSNSITTRFSRKFMVRQSKDTLWGFIDDADSERPYFIFKQVPDSFTIKKIKFSDPISKKVFIDTIRIMPFGNLNLKVWKGKSYYQKLADGYTYDTCSLTFAERIGPIDDLMPYFAFEGHPGSIDKKFKYGLVCYEDTEIGTLKFMDLDCNIVPVQDVINNRLLKSYFNATNRNLEIHLEDENINKWKLSLINISGQVILTSVLSQPHTSIFVPYSLSDGIYFIYLVDMVNSKTATKKIFIY